MVGKAHEEHRRATVTSSPLTLTIPLQPRWSPLILGHAGYTVSMVGKVYVEHRWAAITSSPLTLTTPLATGTCCVHRYDGGQSSHGAQASHSHQLFPDGGQGSCRAQASCGHQLSPDGGQGSCGAQASHGHHPSLHTDHPPAATLVPLGTGTCWAH